MASTISRVNAHMILDSRGWPTVEVVVTLASGLTGVGRAPAGASTGSAEAKVILDGGAAFNGRGVKRAVESVQQCIGPKLCGMDPAAQAAVDTAMLALDGTPDKSNLGANAMVAVSMAVAVAAAQAAQMPLYAYLQQQTAMPMRLPVPQLNIINGGAHANNNLDIQEFMLVPVGAGSFSEALRFGVEVYHALKALCQQQHFATTVGDEGGFAPNLQSNRQALDLLMQAITQTGLVPGEEVALALDVAATEFYREAGYVMLDSVAPMTAQQMVSLYQGWLRDYPIVSIEDGLAETDWQGWQAMTAQLGQQVQLVGDDLLVTQPDRLQRGLELQACNAVLIKPNQVGTLTETLASIKLAQAAGWGVVISHRSGETEDTFIADLAVGMGAGQIKAGAPARGERVAKYNQLLRIEAALANQAIPWQGWARYHAETAHAL